MNSGKNGGKNIMLLTGVRTHSASQLSVYDATQLQSGQNDPYTPQHYNHQVMLCCAYKRWVHDFVDQSACI